MKDNWGAKRKQVRIDCAQRGISIQRQGKAYRLIGKNIDLLVADLTWIVHHDFRQTDPWQDRGWNA